MALQSGLAAQVGMVAETGSYGNAGTPTRFFEFDSESIEPDLAIVDDKGLGRGRFMRNDRTKRYARGYGGNITCTLQNKDFGLILQHALGNNTVTNVSGSSADKLHTIQPDSNALQGKWMTVQVGRPDVNGTVQPFTYAGGKVLGFELGAALDEYVKLSMDWDFATASVATALASASYTATREGYIWKEGAITLGGTTIYVRSLKIKVDNKLATDRRFLGNTKKEPLANDFAEVSGEIEVEFENLSRYNTSLNGAQAALSVVFTSPTNVPTTSNAFKCQVDLAKVELGTGFPKVGGPDIVRHSIPFRSLDDGTNPVIKILYTTSDTAP